MFNIKSRILIGFGAVLMLLMTASAASILMSKSINHEIADLRQSLDDKGRAADLDLLTQKVRVRVNQWLRSFNPVFAKQADALLVEQAAAVAKEDTISLTGKTKETIQKTGSALQAYILSWGVVQKLYLDEGNLYDEKIDAAAIILRGDLAKIRDSELSLGAMDALRHIFLATDRFVDASSRAVSYRMVQKPEQAASVIALTNEVIASLERAASLMKEPDGAKSVARIVAGVTTWRSSFEQAVRMAQTRVDRVTVWTRDEGEVMAQGANILRADAEQETARKEATLIATLDRSELILYGATAVALLLSIVATILVSSSITRPIGRMTSALRKLAAGDQTTAVPETGRRDEIGDMARAAEVFKQNGLDMLRLKEASEENGRLTQVERLRNEQERQRVEAEKAVAADQQAQIVGLIDAGLDRLAQGDLTFRIKDEVADSYVTLRDNFNAAVTRLSDTIATMQSTSSEVANAAHEINSGADDLSKRTEEQASSLEETAATTEELAASVKASAQNARQAASIAQQALTAAEGGGVIAGQAVEAMARIETASQKISDIIRVIDDIAFQTNLLALNAAVEAARAGDAGKGFAVVASEVRTLAQRSGEAAKDISSLISSSNLEVGEGVKLVRQAGEALTNIREASHKVAATIAEISAASGEQASGIDEMSQAVAHLDEMTQANAALAEQSAASASALTHRIGQLDQLVATFKIERGETAVQAKPLGFAQKVGQALAMVTPHLRTQTPARKRASNGNSGWSEF